MSSMQDAPQPQPVERYELPKHEQLPSSPAPVPRETLFSYFSRWSASKGTSAADFAYDMGLSLKRILNLEGEALERLEKVGDLDLATMQELVSWTGERAGNVRMRFRGEIFVSRALRNPVVRGCPVCLREDAEAHGGAAVEAMAMRGDWQFREASLCVRHHHLLVPLWTAPLVNERHDTGSRLREIEGRILGGSFDFPREMPTPYDLWLDGRLQDGRDETWLADHSVYSAATFCRLLGAELMRLTPVDGLDECRSRHAAQAAGFAVARQGEVAIRDALETLASTATGHNDEPLAAFGKLYATLAADHLDEADFAVFRGLLRACILDIWPIDPGVVLLGERVSERRLHSLVKAALEINLSKSTLERFLVEAGAIAADDPRPDSRKTFHAAPYAELLKEIQSWVGVNSMRTLLGATRSEWRALVQDDVIAPRNRLPGVKARWGLSDASDLVAELDGLAQPVESDDPDWESFLQAKVRSGLSVGRILAAIREGDVPVGRRAELPDFRRFVVPREAIDRLSGWLQPVMHTATTAASAFGRLIGVRSARSILGLVKAGHTPGLRVEHPGNGIDWFVLRDSDIVAFHARFMTPTTMGQEFGLHRNTVRAVLKAHDVSPFSPDGQDYGAIYLRDEVAPIFAAAVKAGRR